MTKHINITKSINNIETAIKALDAVENIVTHVQSMIINEKKELSYTLEVIKEATGSIGAVPNSPKAKKNIKPLSKEKQAEVFTSFFKTKKSPAATGLKTQ